MNIYKNNKVVGMHEQPNYDDHFNSCSPDAVQNNKRYQTLARQDTLYLLLPDYERVKVTSFLVEPLLIARVNDSFDMIGPEFFVRTRQLVRPMVRSDGQFEMRGVEVEGSYRPHSHDNVSWWDSDRKFVNEYVARPLKRVSVGAEVFVVPGFKRFVVLDGSEDGLGMRVVRKNMVGLVPSLVVRFEDVRVLQNFRVGDGDGQKILLMPDFRGISP